MESAFYGQAIFLGTRYEGMRKMLVEGPLRQSILIIQEKVYLSLSRELREGFQEVDLEEHAIVVRDDPAARKMFTLLLKPQEAGKLADDHSMGVFSSIF